MFDENVSKALSVRRVQQRISTRVEIEILIFELIKC